MSIRSRIVESFRTLTRAEKRPRVSEWDDFWYERQPFENSTGIDVNEDISLTYSAVWACRKVISEDLGSLPLHVYRRRGDTTEKAREHPLYGLLHDAPNPEMSAMQFRETLEDHLLGFGNAYAQIQRNLRGEIMALWPLNPAPERMKPSRNSDDELIYEYRLEDGSKTTFQRDEIFHVAGLGFNGLIGYSPIGYQREAVAVGLAAQQFQGSNFKNGGRLQLAFVHPAPKAPNEEGRKAFREAIRKEYGGPRGNTVGVLWEGMKPEKLSMTMEDAQFIESRKFNRTEICAIYRVPPHKIMDLERATFSNIEQQSISYVIDTIRPWAVRWEQAINMQLLDTAQGYYAEHNLEGLMRGDILSRYQAYAIGRQWGWLTVNMILGKENENPVEGGDTRMEPLNMVSIDEHGKKDQLEAAASKPVDTPVTDKEKEQAARVIRELKLLAVDRDAEADAARLKLVPSGTHPGQQHREGAK